jgi:hypothetical protein
LAFPATQIQDVWTVFRDYAPSAPDAVSAMFGIDRAGPDAGFPDEMIGQPIAFLAWNHSGSATDVERDTAGLRVGPRPTTTMIGSVPYLEVQTAHDLAFAWGSRSFINSHNANDVRREALDELVELVATAPGEGTFSVTALGGAIARVPEDATAYAGRASAFDLSADSNWTDPALDESNADWCRRALAVEPDRALGATPATRCRPRYVAPDLRRRQACAARRPEAQWDPDNAFRQSQRHAHGWVTNYADSAVVVPGNRPVDSGETDGIRTSPQAVVHPCEEAPHDTDPWHRGVRRGKARQGGRR